MSKASGSCLCGSSKYTVNGEITDSSYCHCSICRRLSGAAYAAYGSTLKSNFVWDCDISTISNFQQTQDATRWFCNICGSPLMTEHISEPENCFITLGTLDKHDPINIEYHQFTESAADWEKINDDLQKYPAWPDIT